MLHACRTAGFEPAITHFTNDFATAYGLVAIGAGFALVPDLAGPPPARRADRPDRAARSRAA